MPKWTIKSKHNVYLFQLHLLYTTFELRKNHEQDMKARVSLIKDLRSMTQAFIHSSFDLNTSLQHNTVTHMEINTQHHHKVIKQFYLKVNSILKFLLSVYALTTIKQQLAIFYLNCIQHVQCQVRVVAGFSHCLLHGNQD